MTEFELMQLSSLERVFLDSDGRFFEIGEAACLKGERFSYQLAFKSNAKFTASISVKSELSEYISIRSVGNVPSELPCYPDHDEKCERTNPGLFPDVLFPIDNGELLVKPGNYYSVFVTVEVPKSIKADNYDITISIQNAEKGVNCSQTMKLKVINAVLPEQKLIYTQWFHADCIANYFNVPVFSDIHWKITDNFMATAAHTGVNMILTPIFTPPLDTAVGGERLTVQLVDVSLSGEKYSFGFEKLRKWISMAKKNGFRYFEISHLFSQWGAIYAPKIMATVDGKYTRLFGWDTDAASKEYSQFLQSFLPELISVLKEEKIEHNTYFHISDEPNKEQCESYGKAKSIVADILKDFPIIDALSDYEFYEQGLINNPIPCTTEIENFIDRGFPHPWTYYCCGQHHKLSNRFFSMPLSRTRAIGLQMYKYSIEGFLQWGYNFYNSQYSLRTINPYLVTDADGAFPSGDAFTVYPYNSGAIESLRSEAFFNALQDMRALELLSEKLGKDKLINIIENEFGKITFTQYPGGIKEVLLIRTVINNLIEINVK